MSCIIWEGIIVPTVFPAKNSLKNGKNVLDTGDGDCYNKQAENEVGTDGVRPHPAAECEQRSIITFFL